MSQSPNRLLATVFGVVYVIIGALGFTATSGIGFFATKGGLLLGIFEVNAFHNVAHLVIGAALLLAGVSSISAARRVNAVIGAAYLVLGVVGIFVVGSDANILALNAPDHVLHLVSAVILLGVGLAADNTVRPASA